MKEESKSVAPALKSGGFEVKILVDQFSMHHIGAECPYMLVHPLVHYQGSLSF